MNKIFLIGNLTRDPESGTTSGGVSVTHFDIAVDRPRTDETGERQTDFFNCTAWRGLAESIARYCKKGNKVAVSGSIQIRTYEDNRGNRRTAVDVIAQDVEFLTPRPQNAEPVPPAGGAARRRPLLESFDDAGDIPF